ncbi:MAG: hypothetical protein AAFN38_24015 [Cyanobacteria bacterium J06560_5]
MTSSTHFDQLVIGLAALKKSKQRYPYPRLLQLALHHLSLVMGSNYPVTERGLMRLFEQPVSNWYVEPVPKLFDPGSSLLYDSEISEEADSYLFELLETSLSGSLRSQQLALENFRFRELLESLRGISEKDIEAAQQEYVLLRRFLIEHPYTTTAELRETFGRLKHVSTARVGEFYNNPARETLSVWVCDRCGPLDYKRGRLKGVKPSVCNDHRKEVSYVHRLEPQRGWRRLKRGLHLRICIPGVPEVSLFRALELLCDSKAAGLTQVELYPGLDRYDLRLQFSDSSVWAVDVKDYPDPKKLSVKLTPIPGGGSLRYDKSFYVVSQAYVERERDYVTTARRLADKLPKHTQLVSDTAFLQQVEQTIEKLKTAES